MPFDDWLASLGTLDFIGLLFIAAVLLVSFAMVVDSVLAAMIGRRRVRRATRDTLRVVYGYPPNSTQVRREK